MMRKLLVLAMVALSWAGVSLLRPSLASAQPTTIAWRPPTCTDGQGLFFYAVSARWICTPATAISGTITAGKIPVASSSMVLVDSPMTVSGTAVSTSGTLGVTGLSTLTGGFTAGAASSMGSFKITSLADGTVATDAATFGQIGAAVSGTINTVPMFTGVNVIGNSTFPIINTSATALAIGDSTSADVTTISGRASLSMTDATATHGLRVDNTATATAVDTSAIIASRAGTTDATAAVRVNQGILVSATTSRSAGANAVTNNGIEATANGAQQNRAVRASVDDAGANTNIAVYATSSALGASNTGILSQVTGAGTTNIGGDFTATGATTNIALRTISGNNYLNSTDGNAGIGVASAGTLSGKLSITSTTTAANGIYVTHNPVAATASQASITAATGGTLDTTTSALTSYGVWVNSASTRSAGANNLTNVAMQLTASGAQVNRALVTAAGDVLLNNTSGTTTLGFTAATASALTVIGQAAFTSTLSTANAFTSTWTPSGGTTSALAAVRGTAAGTIDTTAGALSVHGLYGNASTTESAGANTLTVIGVRGDVSSGDDRRGLSGVASGSGAATSYAVYGSSSATTTTTYGAYFESTGAGTNNFGGDFRATGTGTSNFGGSFTATGATTNIALRTVSGSNYLNATDGSTGVGYTSGATIPAKLAVSSALSTVSALAITRVTTAGTTTTLAGLSVANSGTLDSTAGSIDSRGASITNSSTESAGANTFTKFGLTVVNSGTGDVSIAGHFDTTGATSNVALRTVSGDVNLNVTAGSTGVGYATAAALPAKLSVTSTGATSLGDFLLTTAASTSTLNTVNVLSNGTFDTTGAVRDSRGIKSVVTSTRSAGANNLTNTAGYFEASGAQVNYSIVSKAGDVLLDGNAHVGVAGTDPTLTCGTTPTVVGADAAGNVTVGTGVTTSCTVTFAVARAVEPACVVTAKSTAALYFSAKSTTGFTVTTPGGTDLASTSFSYHCFDM